MATVKANQWAVEVPAGEIRNGIVFIRVRYIGPDGKEAVTVVQDCGVSGTGTTDVTLGTEIEEPASYNPPPFPIWVGYGIVLGSHGFSGPKMSGAAVLEQNKLYHDNMIAVNSFHQSSLIYETGETISSLLTTSSVDISGSVDINVLGFIGSTAATDYSFHSSLSSSINSKYSVGRIEEIVENQRLIDPSPTALLKYRTASFKADSITKPADWIVSIYGAVVPVSIDIGGILEFYGNYIGSSLNTMQSFRMGYAAAIRGIIENISGQVSGGVSYGTTEQASEYKKNTFFNYFRLGGHNRTYLALEDLLADTSSWVNSVNSNTVPCSVRTYLPIYYLIEDPQKAQEVKAEIEARLAGIVIPDKRIYTYNTPGVSTINYTPAGRTRVEVTLQGGKGGSRGDYKYNNSKIFGNEQWWNGGAPGQIGAACSFVFYIEGPISMNISISRGGSDGNNSEGMNPDGQGGLGNGADPTIASWALDGVNYAATTEGGPGGGRGGVASAFITPAGSSAITEFNVIAGSGTKDGIASVRFILDPDN
jgi:hypothetical protein